MPITELQRERRRKHIGSSDVAAILNMDQFRSSADVWVSKTHDLADNDPTLAMQIGNHLERGLLELSAEKRGLKIKIGGPTRVSKADPLFAANPDALVLGQPLGMEAKLVGRRNYTSLDQWGEDGSSDVPDNVQLQVQHQMFVVELQAVIVVAYLAGDFREYTIQRDDELIDAITTQCGAWWKNYLLTGICPEDYTPDIEVLKRVRRVPKTSELVDPMLAEQYTRACECFKAADTYKDQCQAALILAMHGKEAADWADPDFVFTYLEQSRESLDQQAIRTKHPEIAKKFTNQTTHRVLRKAKRSKFDDYCNG